MDETKTQDPDLAVSVNPPPASESKVELALDVANAIVDILDHVDQVLAPDDIATRKPEVLKVRALFKKISDFWKPARERN